MFSSRRFGWKMSAALAAIAALGVLAAFRARALHPPVWECMALPQRWDGASVWLAHARILSVSSEEYEVDTSGVRIRVAGPAPAAVGGWVSVRGTFRADGPRVTPIRARVLPEQYRLRWLVEAVSVAVILLILANFARHFVFRPERLQVHG